MAIPFRDLSKADVGDQSVAQAFAAFGVVGLPAFFHENIHRFAGAVVAGCPIGFAVKMPQIGHVSGDLNNLTILLEPGTWQFNDSSDRPGGEDDYPANKPLRSVKL